MRRDKTESLKRMKDQDETIPQISSISAFLYITKPDQTLPSPHSEKNNKKK